MNDTPNTTQLAMDDLPHQDSCRWWRHGDLCDCGAAALTTQPAMELPALPEPDYIHEDGHDEYGYATHGRAYTADQMRAYGEACRASASSAAVGKPMFWVRLRSDGGYEGPIPNEAIEKARKLSGAWFPLYLGATPPSAQAQAQPAPVAVDEREIESTVLRLMDAVTEISRVSDRIGQSRGANTFAANGRAVNAVVDLKDSLERELRAALQSARSGQAFALLREAQETIDTLPGYPKGADLCDRIDQFLDGQDGGDAGLLMKLAGIAAECSGPDTTDALDALIANTGGGGDAGWERGLRRDEIVALISPLSNNSADHDIEFAHRVIDAMNKKA